MLSGLLAFIGTQSRVFLLVYCINLVVYVQRQPYSLRSFGRQVFARPSVLREKLTDVKVDLVLWFRYLSCLTRNAEVK